MNIPQPIQFKVLRAFDPNSIALSQPLNVEGTNSPTSFANACGGLKSVDTVECIRSLAADSAKRILNSLN